MPDGAPHTCPSTPGGDPCVQCTAAELPLPLQVLFTATCGVQDGPLLSASEAERRLKVADLNKMLDELTKPENKKSPILTELVKICSPRMMFWITKIILKDMKVRPSNVVWVLAARSAGAACKPLQLRTEGQAEQPG